MAFQYIPNHKTTFQLSYSSFTNNYSWIQGYCCFFASYHISDKSFLYFHCKITIPKIMLLNSLHWMHTKLTYIETYWANTLHAYEMMASPSQTQKQKPCWCQMLRKWQSLSIYPSFWTWQQIEISLSWWWVINIEVDACGTMWVGSHVI